MKISIIGGGSSYTPELIEGIINNKNIDIKEIVLCDIKDGQEKLDIIYDLSRRMLKKANLDIKIKKTLDKKEAIENSSFVISQIRVGGLKSRLNDEKIPLKYDLLGQETTGVGGFFKALRTIPVIFEICDYIEKYAKDAYLINFANPAGIVTQAVLKHKNTKVIGVCNVPITMKNMISDLLKLDKNKLEINFIGLNHFVYIHDIYYERRDIFDDLLKVLETKNINMKNIDDLKFDMDLLKSLRLIPCPYHKYFYMKDKMLKKQQISLKTNNLRANQVIKIEKDLFEVYKKNSLDEKPIELEKRGGSYYSDVAISLIDSISNDKRDIHVLNVLNNGVINSLPKDSVIETNCIVGKNGIKPIKNKYSKLNNVIGMLRSIKSYEDLTIESVYSKNKEKAILALIENPLIVDYDKAKLVFEDMLEVNKKYIKFD